MRHWHRQFLGRTQLPVTLSALAICEFFTLDGGEARAVLSRSIGITFDGTHIWVANSGNVMKFRVRDFKLLGTFPVSTATGLMAFDGANIWVALDGSRGVAKM